MKLYTLLKRGTEHPNYCEDFLFSTEVNTNFIVGAVFDGCSGGDNSHFASALFGKILRQICISPRFTAFSGDIETFTKEILHQLLQKVIAVKNEIELDVNDLLATIIIFGYKKSENEAYIIACGDGLIAINQAIVEIDQQNTPNYAAYSFEKLVDYTEFLTFIQQNTHTFFIKNVQDFSISTDGIFTYLPIQGQQKTQDISAPEYLCNDLFLEKILVMLGRKHNILRTKSALENADDIAMIRLIKDQ